MYCIYIYMKQHWNNNFINNLRVLGPERPTTLSVKAGFCYPTVVHGCWETSQVDVTFHGKADATSWDSANKRARKHFKQRLGPFHWCHPTCWLLSGLMVRAGGMFLDAQFNQHRFFLVIIRYKMEKHPHKFSIISDWPFRNSTFDIPDCPGCTSCWNCSRTVGAT